MKTKLLFVTDKKAQAICAAWLVTTDAHKIARITKLSLVYVGNELDRLWQAGVLDLDKENRDKGILDHDVQLYIEKKTKRKAGAYDSRYDDDVAPASEQAVQ